MYSILLLILYLFWSKFVIGYCRYGGALPILGYILIIKLFVDSFKSKRIILTLFASGLICICFLSTYTNYKDYSKNALKTILFYRRAGLNSIIYDTKKIFLDRNNVKYDIDGIWGSVCDDSGVTTLLNVDDNIMHLEKGFKTTPNKLTEQLYNKKLKDNTVYIPMYNSKMDCNIEYLNQNGFKISEIVGILRNVSFLNNADYIYIAKLASVKNYINIKQYVTVDAPLSIETDYSDINISANIAINPNYINSVIDSTSVDIIGIRDGSETIIDTLTLKTDGSFINYYRTIDNNLYDEIKMQISKSKDNIFDNNAIVFNFRVEKK
jgi:hypothetical protein